MYTNTQSIPVSNKTKMSDLINFRLKVLTIDNRYFVGSLLAFDKHFNLVLADTEELRATKKSLIELKKNGEGKPDFEKRPLGLVILRGEQIVSLSIESAPTTSLQKRVGLPKGKGLSGPLKGPTGTKGKLVGTLRGPTLK